jgi:hypothetical protein
MKLSQLNFTELPKVSLADKSKLPKVSGIYFVINQNQEFLYIGRAINLLFRWRDHHRFNQLCDLSMNQNINIYWWECSPEENILISAEQYYIKKYKPLLNSTIVPTICKTNFALILSQLTKNTIIMGLFNRDFGYELVLAYAFPKKYESKKIANLLKQCQNDFIWTKNYIKKTPFWIGDYQDKDLSKQLKVKVVPCIVFGLFWRECNSSSMKTLVLGVPIRIVDWRTYFNIPDEPNFLDLSQLDELVNYNKKQSG